MIECDTRYSLCIDAGMLLVQFYYCQAIIYLIIDRVFFFREIWYSTRLFVFDIVFVLYP